MSEPFSLWKRLRLKNDPTADDVSWATTNVTPNRAEVLIGGTATAGAYSIRLVGTVRRQSGDISVDCTVSAVRAAETSAQMAAVLEALLDAAVVKSGSDITLASLGIVASVSSATITIVFPPDAHITLSGSAVAPATVTFPLTNTVPICAPAPLALGGNRGRDDVNGVVVVLNQMDDAGETLLAPGSGTISLQVVELIELTRLRSDGTKAVSYRYAGMATLTGMQFGVPIELPVKGAKHWTVRLLTDASLDASTDSIEVIYRDSVT